MGMDGIIPQSIVKTGTIVRPTIHYW